jgi:hypothetical protein
MTQREQAIVAARIAGYHADVRTFTRLRCAVRVNNAVLQQAYWAGERAKREGMLCQCLDCQDVANQTL